MTSANAGIGTQAHLTQMLFLKAAGIDLNVIAYKGARARRQRSDGRTPGLDDRQRRRAGRLHPGGQGPWPVRHQQVPRGRLSDVPTAEEAGLPGFSAVGWFGLAAPRGTPDAVIQRLNAALVAGWANPRRASA